MRSTHKRWNALIKAEHGNGPPCDELINGPGGAAANKVEQACHPVELSGEELEKYQILVSGNVGSAVRHGDIIREWQAHVVALQEIKCDPAQLLGQFWECKKKGWS